MKCLGFAGFSGAGKTTLIEKLIPILVRRGLRVALIKHAHHRFEIDTPGKDSWRHREAGATEVLITSEHRWALMHELRGAPEPSLEEQLARLSPCDVVLIEGYKRHAIPKIEIHREAHGRPLLQPDDPTIVAVAADTPIVCGVPLLDLNRVDEIARFLFEYLDLGREESDAVVR